MERRLVAILAADVVGYSSLMERDEAGTLAALKSLREELFDPKIAAHNGRIVKLMGDGTLVDFASVVDAVVCAVDIQRAMAVRNAEAPAEGRIDLRIGVNLGDVIIEGDDIYGDGVNIAARLEGLAEPGGVCVSRTVFNHVRHKADIGFEDLGEHQVKNISEPVVVYRALIHVEAGEEPRAAPKRQVGWRKPVLAGAAAALVVIAGLLIWQRPWAPGVEPASLERMAHPLPDKPSIAVLPFTNMSDDPSQEYFTDGMTEDLITDLSKISGLFVIARNSVFTYKGKAVEVRQVAEDLGVRYVLEGSVRRAGEQVRINTQLIDATTGGHLWADRYDGSLDNIFALQDKVTQKIVAALAVKLTEGEELGRGQTETDNPDAYDAFLKGWDHYLRQRPDDFGTAIGHFETAIDLDPNYARAYAALAATYWQSWKRFWHAEVGMPVWHDARFRAGELLEKAMENPTPLAHQVAADGFLHSQQHEAAISEAERAVALDPNDADSFITLASALSLAGRPDEALAFVERAMRLNPHHPPSYLYELGLAQFGMARYDEAAGSLEKATILNPEDRWSLRLLLATYGLLGRGEDAARVFRAITDAAKHGSRRYYLSYLDPLTIRASAFWHPYKDPVDAERFAEGLRQAGVPD
jgi:TolB-like protein/class 3 adenylate cyclase/Flp pilus assembly protein TadD